MGQLLIPGKASPEQPQPQYGTDMRAIEVWSEHAGGIQEVSAGTSNVTITNPFGPQVFVSVSASGAFYASLTGPGETNPTGALTQAGNFTVAGTIFTGGNAITDNSSGGLTISEIGTGTISVNGPSVGINATGGSGTATLSGTGGASAGVSVASGAHLNIFGNGLVQLVSAAGHDLDIAAAGQVVITSGSGTVVEAGGGHLGFFGATAIVKPTITGSRSDPSTSGALYVLLQALQTYGLIVDTTTV